jgi:uncharacterized membrane protein
MLMSNFKNQVIRFARQWALCALVIIIAAHVATACPTCKESLSANDPQMMRGYFWSIMFMMAMPFSILTAISTYFYVLICKARNLKDNENNDSAE